MAMIVNSLAEAVVSQLFETLTTLIKKEFKMLLGVHDELQELQKEVSIIHGVVESAERRAVTDSAIRSWLADVKDIVYDADDVVDHVRTQSEKLARLSSEQAALVCSSYPLLSCFPRLKFRHQIGRRIRSISNRLAITIKNAQNFNLAIAHRDERGSSKIYRQTGPLVEPNIVGSGIEKDMTELVDLLTREGGSGVQIYAITGMGGIGKTTLAQKIYNHKTIRRVFQMPPPIWVCVSKDYSPTNLLEKVLRGANADPGPDRAFAELELMLGGVIKGKKFFLILDDVWDHRVWEDFLRKALLRGVPSSRILITTRDEIVAKKMGAVHRCPVRLLSPQEGWSLLCKIVFQNNEEGIDFVKSIGQQIVEKCHGLPLAIKTIAGMLRTKDRTREEWEKVLNKPAWSSTDLPEGVMGVLYLSYEDLPLHLKQCFIYCSLFPEDFKLSKETLTNLWVAEGFVKEEGEMIIEDVALEYYRELLGRNLLQPGPMSYEDDECKIHDLLRSLGQFLAGDENLVGDVKALSKVSSSTWIKVRRLCILNSELDSILNVVKELKSLRTLILINSPTGKAIPQDLFKKLSCLRVMFFDGTNFTSLPESVGNLIHLRFLNFNESSIKTLPKTIGSLSNLRCLILEGCPSVSNIPRSIMQLYNLRVLSLSGTSVDGIHAGIGRLQHLNVMMGFVTNQGIDEGWCSLEELRSLSQLRVLTIVKLERALVRRSRTRARGFLLKEMTHLSWLSLGCTPSTSSTYGNEEVKVIQEVFEEELFPPPSLTLLHIVGFFGLRFPSWMMASNVAELLPNLRFLHLGNCQLCKQLPTLGLLPKLDLLGIDGALAVETVGPEFMGFNGGFIPFPKLATLWFEEMPKWVEWQWVFANGSVAMPCLKELRLVNCPSLRSLPEGLCHATKLIDVAIVGANSLRAVENLVSVRDLKLLDNPNLERISNLPVQELLIRGCPKIREMKGLDALQSLSLDSLSVPSFVDQALEDGWRSAFPSLQEVYIVEERQAVTVNQRSLDAGSVWPRIQHMPHVNTQALSRPGFMMYNRDPLTFNTNPHDVAAGQDMDIEEH